MRAGEEIPQSPRLRERLQDLRERAHQRRILEGLLEALLDGRPTADDVSPELLSSGSVIGFGHVADSPFTWAVAVAYPQDTGQRHVGVAWTRQGKVLTRWLAHEGELPLGWNALSALRLVDDETRKGDETVASWKPPSLYPNTPKPRGWALHKIQLV